MSGAAAWHGNADGCVGFAPKSNFTVPCTEPPVCEVLAIRDCVPQVWRKACQFHADALSGVLNDPAVTRYSVVTRPLAEVAQ